MAKAGQMDAVRIMAKDLVRTKKYVKKFIVMKANIQAVSLKISTLKSQDAMMNAMKGVTKAMRKMNNQMKLPQMQKIMADFERQTEMLDDVMDDAMAGSDEEEETDEIVRQVFGELGLQLTDELGGISTGSSLPSTSATAKQPTAVAAGGADDADLDLEERLNNLRRD